MYMYIYIYLQDWGPKLTLSYPPGNVYTANWKFTTS